MATILNINRDYRNLIEKMQNLGLLGFDKNTQTKDIFELAVALGCDNPSEVIKNNDTYVRVEFLKSEDNALLSCLLLSQVKENDDIEKYTNLDANYDLAEKCAASGFLTLQEYVNNCNDDPEILAKQMMIKLDLLYEAKVK